jgi:hypothetical protein
MIKLINITIVKTNLNNFHIQKQKYYDIIFASCCLLYIWTCYKLTCMYSVTASKVLLCYCLFPISLFYSFLHYPFFFLTNLSITEPEPFTHSKFTQSAFPFLCSHLLFFLCFFSYPLNTCPSFSPSLHLHLNTSLSLP